MIRVLKSVAAIVIIIIASCGKDHEGLPTSFEYVPPPTPTNFEVTAGVESAHLSWSYTAEGMAVLREFRIYYYYSMYDILELIDTSTDTAYTDSLLIGNVEYCYVVSAVDTTGLEGWRTAKRCVIVLSGAR